MWLYGSWQNNSWNRFKQKIKHCLFNTDAEIEKSLNFNIMELFLNKQEGYFRKLETKILNSFKKTNLKNKSSFIVSTGGGMFTHNKNINFLLN